MKKELLIKKCKKCGAMVKVLKDCTCENCGIKCCGEEMEMLTPNSVEASFEKHIPTYEKISEGIFVKVNHVMDKDHYIEWLALVTDNKEYVVTLYPEQNAECEFPYIPGSTLYAYCNKHGLWKEVVK